MATEVIKTIKPSGGDYTSLSAWEAGEQADLVSADEIAVAECYSMQDTASVTILGWTTDATRYIKIYTPTSERHDGKWNGAKYRVTNTIAVQEDYVRIDGLQIALTTSDVSLIGIYVDSISASNDIRISNNIIRGVLSGTASACYGILITHTNILTEIWNNIIYDFVNGTNFCIGFLLWESSTSDLYNNTAQNCYYGYYQNVGTVNATNCGAAGCNTAFTGTISQTTCSSSTPTFVDEGNDDFHLASSDTTWKDQGTSDPGSGLFPDDIDGETRSGSWDIGADEYVGGISSIVPLRRRIEGY